MTLFKFCQDLFFICNIVSVFEIYSLICSLVAMLSSLTCMLIGMLVRMLQFSQGAKWVGGCFRKGFTCFSIAHTFITCSLSIKHNLIAHTRLFHVQCSLDTIRVAIVVIPWVIHTWHIYHETPRSMLGWQTSVTPLLWWM